jgi:hypothetical protein
MREAPNLRHCTWSISNENRIGLVNGAAVSIHHVGNAGRFSLTAFILRERRGDMVNRRYRTLARYPRKQFRREPDVKSALSRTDFSEGAGMKSCQ